MFQTMNGDPGRMVRSIVSSNIEETIITSNTISFFLVGFYVLAYPIYGWLCKKFFQQHSILLSVSIFCIDKITSTLSPFMCAANFLRKTNKQKGSSY